MTDHFHRATVRYRNASKTTHAVTTVIAVGLLIGAFWYLDLRKDKDHGAYDAAIVLGIFLTAVAIAFPDRLAKLGQLLSRTKLGNGGKE